MNQKEKLLAAATPEEWDWWLDCTTYRYWASPVITREEEFSTKTSDRLKKLRSVLFPRSRFSSLTAPDFPIRALARLEAAGIWEEV